MATKKKATGKKASKTTRTKATPKKKRAATKKKAASTKKRAKPSPKDEPVTIDRRRGERRDEQASAGAPATGERRQKVQRRRQIDPTTCERDYSDAEVEFMNAMDEYKRTSGRMFPTCSEVLEVIRDLGYVQLTSAELTALGRAPQEEVAELEAAEL